MNVTYAKNPASLQVIENPAPKRKRTSAKNGSSTATKRASTRTVTHHRNNPMTTKNMSDTFKKVAGPALSVVAGQAGASQATQLVLNNTTTLNPTMRKAISIGLPFVLAAVLLGQKNEYVKMAGVGAGVVSLQSAIKIIMPSAQAAAAETVDGLRRIARPQASGYLSNASVTSEGRLLMSREQASGKAIGAHNSGFLSSSALPTRATYTA